MRGRGRSSEREKDVRLDPREGKGGRFHQRSCIVLGGDGRAVIDHPDPVMPAKHIRILGSPIHVRYQCIEPKDVGGKIRIERRCKRKSARKKIDADVESGACAEKILDIRIGFRRSEIDIHIYENNFRYRQADRPCQSSEKNFRGQGKGSLTGAPELHDIEAVIVTLHETGERPPFAEGRDVSMRCNAPDRGE